MNREEIILSHITKSGLGLEIGPSYSPVAPKRDGWNVVSIDHLDAGSLRAKYLAWGVDVTKIEEVDYLASGDGIFSPIGEEEKFDYIIASHVIEHMPDIVSFLADCEKLLKLNGVLSLAIPDKNRCFDYLKPLSTAGQIIQAFFEKRNRHLPGVIFDAHALHVKHKKSGEILWFTDVTEDELSYVHTKLEAKKIMDDYVNSGKYMDVHAWQFTPKSFLEILDDLIAIGLTRMRLVSSTETIGHEFFISLRKT